MSQINDENIQRILERHKPTPRSIWDHPRNSSKIILDLCGGTGEWSRPYREAGYDVRLITLPDNDILTYVPPVNVHGILAAPECTEFSVALTPHRERNVKEGLILVDRCLSIIRQSTPKWWAMENPRGFLRKYIGKPPYSFQHWEYGEPYTKPTDIWGFYTLPKPTIFDRPAERNTRTDYEYVSNRRLPKGYAETLDPSRVQSAKRAMTSSKFAYAFYLENP